MKIIVDSSVWIDYFRNGQNSGILDNLIDENLIAVNDLILTEIIPPLQLKKQTRIIDLLNEIENLELHIDWQQIRDFQYICLKKGINKVGISDLIIAQNAIQNNTSIFTLDKHFSLLKTVIGVSVFDQKTLQI
ncbi:MAG TPA: PIN domain-containing protein [bacterium]|jgi:predicted nucleic acid-binding protein|nr:PIN domain-containing protein [bacterium]HNZ53165.1 PIN domain-containing protein [bacterium]HOB70346.1 PIN domain-containing protein [bacterium]HOG43398.1 PIN domain-containing protein [bacterium]HPG35360.1 PIN domain-containing protein [bacterium]